MTTMDSDPIPTEPTTDPEPPVTAPVVPGPSLVSESPAAGRGRGSKLRRAAIGLALVVTFSVGIGVGRLDLPAVGGFGSTTPAPGSASTDFGLIREAWDVLHTKYVGASSLDNSKLIYGAISGMTQAVGDTGHTSFMTPQERASRSDSLSGKFVGIGVRIGAAKDGLPLVVGVIKGSPAEGAGIAVGDEIVAVDGQQTAGHTNDDIVGWVRVAAGTTVTVTVRLGANGTQRDVSMVRAEIPDVHVTWAMVPGTHTALIRLDEFAQGTADALKAALGDIKAAGADRLVLDLRGNPGGYVNEADAVASQFLKSGVVFIERDAQGNETKHEVAAGGLATDLALVVLVDAGTASSSEIVSGALQDAGRAQLVGIKTFGTGTVLGEFPLSDGSALRVGTVEWLTPNGRQIWHQGITPDVVVERASTIAPVDPDQVSTMTPTQIAALTDPQLARALTLVTAVAATGG